LSPSALTGAFSTGFASTGFTSAALGAGFAVIVSLTYFIRSSSIPLEALRPSFLLPTICNTSLLDIVLPVSADNSLANS
jgi:hypothetical protein